MTETVERQSATIYVFPARGRFAVRADQTGAATASARSVKTGCGEAWYHDDAIREAERSRKN